MPIDFKASQVRTSKIIASGSATRPYLLIYPSGSAADDSGTVQNLAGTGSDVWLFISGANGTGTDRVAFGGAVFVSGSLIVNRQAGGGGPTINGNFATGDFLLLDSTGQYLMFGDVSGKRVGIDSGAPSGTLHIGDGDGATPGLVVDDTAIVNYGRNGDNVATFMVRGATGKHEALFVVSASQERIGIRQYNPKAELDISGSVMVTGSMYISGTIFAQEFHTNIVSSSIIYDSGSTKFGDSSDDVHQFTGSAYFKNNVYAREVHSPAFSGSLTTLEDGTPYLVAGTNITLTTGSSGEVTIDSTAGGGTPGGPFFTVQYNNAGVFGGNVDFVYTVPGNRIGMGVPTPKARLHVSSSIGEKETFIYTGSLLAFEGSPVTVPGTSVVPVATFGVTGTLANPQIHGKDTYFYVSGNITPSGSLSPDYAKRGTSVFGGDVVISGSLYGGSPLKINSLISSPLGFTGEVPFDSILVTNTITTSASLNVKNAGTGLPVFNAGNTGIISGSSDFLIGGNIILAGNINSDISEPKSIFSAVTNNISIGTAASTTVVGNLAANGDITVNGNDIKSSTSATALQLTGSGVTVSGKLITSGAFETLGPSALSGSVWMPQGLSGSLTKLTDGTSYLIAGTNVTINSSSNGAVTISAVGGGISTVTGSFNDLGSKFVTTASVSIAGGQGFGYTANNVGSDVYFFVSGSTTAGSGQSVFGGNLVVSGAVDTTALAVGGGYGNTGVSITPAGNIQANGTLAIDSFSTLTGDATFGGNIIAGTNTARSIFTAVTSNPITVGGASSQLIIGGNDLRGTVAGSLRLGVQSSQVLVLSGGAASSTNPINFADTNFYVSGSFASRNTATKGTSVFGGDLVASGNFYADKAVHYASPFLRIGTATVNPSDYEGAVILMFDNHSNQTVSGVLPSPASSPGRYLRVINKQKNGTGKVFLTSSANIVSNRGSISWTLDINDLANNWNVRELISDGVVWEVIGQQEIQN